MSNTVVKHPYEKVWISFWSAATEAARISVKVAGQGGVVVPAKTQFRAVPLSDKSGYVIRERVK